MSGDPITFNSRNPLVSVIIPVFNGERYLRQAIESVVTQSYQNIEVVIVDDGSFDSNFVSQLAGDLRDPRVKLLRKPNLGVASALNFGIFNSHGEFVSWLSHDDVFFPDKIARQIDTYFTLKNSKLVLCSNWIEIDSDGTPIGKSRIFKIESQVFLLDYLFENQLIHGSSFFAHNSIFKNVGFFDESLRFTQDYDYWFRLILSGYQFYVDSQPLILSRTHPEQDSKTKDTLKERNIFWERVVHEIQIRLSRGQLSIYACSEGLHRFGLFLKREGLYESFDLLQSMISNFKEKGTSGRES
jgi:glycosyltransferase involved in cell wall biosynthesis